MRARIVGILVAALLGVGLAGCGTVAALQEVRAVESRLKDSGYANVSVNYSSQTQNRATSRTLTAKVDRPQNAGPDQQVAIQVADLVIMSYPKVQDLDRITVELAGSGPAFQVTHTPSEWRDLVREAREPPGIGSAVLARDVRGNEFEPIDVTTDFPADQRTFHAIVRVRNLPPDTTVKAVWTAVNTHGAAPPNTQILARDIKTDGTRRLHFTMEPNAGSLPRGSYKLDLFWADKLDRTVPFTVAGG